MLRGSAVTAVDVLRVGLWHPGLMAWRAEDALRATFSAAGVAGRFDQALASRQRGQPSRAFVQGDTPWNVLAWVAGWLELQEGRRFVDVGSGAGHAAAVLALLSGASGEAVEPLAALQRRAAAGFGALQLPVTCRNALSEVDLSCCDAVYSGWTCWEAHSREALLAALVALPSGARVVTITHPPLAPFLEARRQAWAWFPWGRDAVFLARRA